ncbi:MAG: baseplate J/gp47 family protein [Nevskiaceae bacterium]|nr:MAG: baseplate J/gp47 family protein [Nevskiaceae bacterium]
MTTITDLGYFRTRLDERLANLIAGYKAIYGDDIQVDPDDMDGEFLSLAANALGDVDALAEVVYNSMNPQSATGLGLSRLVQLNGIKRIAGTYSRVDVVVGGTMGTVIPAGSVVKDKVTGVKWQALTSVELDATTLATVTYQCMTKGAVTALPGALEKIDTPLYGWQTATNPQPATIGRAEETDEELRVRRAASTSTPAQCILDAVYGAIINLSGVRLARVYENFTDVVDANGQPAHSIYSVVEGGAVADIAQIIWNKKTAGTSTIGNLPTVVYDIQNYAHTVNLSRPLYSDVYITVNLTKHPGYPTNGAALIKQALVDYGQTLAIGDDVEQPRLYTPVNTVRNHKITSLYIDTAANPGGVADIVVPFNGLARIDASRIVVNET